MLQGSCYVSNKCMINLMLQGSYYWIVVLQQIQVLVSNIHDKKIKIKIPINFSFKRLTKL